MKTTEYNPSKLEVAFAKAIEGLKLELEKNLPDNEIIKTENHTKADNPSVRFYLVDKDGDPHEVVIKIVQSPDRF